MSDPRSTVAVIGGGFSGAAVAFHLARTGAPANILVFEPRARLGGGLAYGGSDAIPRVNVPATRMSLPPGDSSHFARWLEASGVLAADAEARVGAEAYPRRREFGRYVFETVSPYLVSGAIRHVQDSVASLRRSGGAWRVQTSEKQTFRADIAVIATTHPAPTLPPQLRPLRDDPGLIADPLADNVVANVAPEERVLIVGAGLTSADLVAALEAQGHRGAVLMISRHGLRARGRLMAADAPLCDFLARRASTATALLRQVRATIRACEAEGSNWQAAIEAVRNQGQEIWQGLDVGARRRIVRHLRPFWDAHRFRAAPQIEAILDAKLKNGTMALKRARLGAVNRSGAEFAVELRDLRRGASEWRRFDRILVATGPTHRDILTSQPYLAELASAGTLTLDPTELGLSTSLDGNAIGKDGAAQPLLFVAGPLARGAFGELMGLPQVSAYAQFVADRVSATLNEISRSRDASVA